MNIPKPATRPNNIRLLHLIAFFGALYFYLPILTLFLQERGLSLLQVNSLWGIIVGTMFLAEVPTGVLADRMGRKRSIVVALGLQLLGELIFIFADRYWLFALSSITGGLGFAFSSGAFEALLFDSLKQVGQEKRMAEVSGLNAAFKQAAFVIGALASGLIAPELTPSRFILLISLTALSVLLAVLVSLFLHEPAPSMDQPPPNSLQLLNQGLHQLRSSVPLQKIILLTILGKPFLDYLTNLYQPYFVERQVAPIWLGITFALGSLQRCWRPATPIGWSIYLGIAMQYCLPMACRGYSTCLWPPFTSPLPSCRLSSWPGGA